MKNKTILNVILFISIFALIAAYFVEYILGYKPCNLCLIERLPYFFAIIIILLYLTINRFEKLIIDFSAEINSFQNTLSIIENLDLVISVDTAVAHIAATMDKLIS